MKPTHLPHPTSIPKSIPEITFQILSILDANSSGGITLAELKNHQLFSEHPNIVKWLSNMYQQGYLLKGVDTKTKISKYALNKRGIATIESVNLGETIVKLSKDKPSKPKNPKKQAKPDKKLPIHQDGLSKQQETEELSPEQRQIEMYLSDHGHKFMESAQNVIEENAIYRATLIQIYNLIGNKLNLK